MRIFFRVLLLACFCAPLAAQTYTPKTLRFEGVPESDRAQLLQLTGLTPGVAVTKEQIEAALQKIAESGAYDDLSYNVGPQALVILLKPIAGNDAMPVAYTNFVWWTPTELEALVEGRVAGFHGALQLHSSMTKDVTRALEAIMQDKGIPAQVSVAEDTMHHVVALSVTSPAVVFGDLKLSEELNPATGGTAKLEHGMKGREFNSLTTPETIKDGVLRVFSGGGYLDATVEPPVFTAPHMIGTAYVVDGSATVHRGDVYHIASVTFAGAPAGTESSLRKDANVKVGGVASPAAARLNNADLEGELATFGYLSAKSTESSTKDVAAHMVTYTFTILPGAMYHLSSVDASRATPDIQAAIAKDKRLQAGVVIDHVVTSAITEDIMKFDVKREQHLSTNIHLAGNNEASITLLPAALPPRR